MSFVFRMVLGWVFQKIVISNLDCGFFLGGFYFYFHVAHEHVVVSSLVTHFVPSMLL